MLKLLDKDGRLVPFVLNDVQLLIYQEIKEMEDAGLPVRIIIVKGRQLGCSTVIVAYLCWKVFLRQGQKALLVAHDLEPAGQLFQKAEMFYDLFPEEVGFKPPLAPGKRSGRKITLDAPLHGLLYVETSANKAAGRSGTFRHVHATEIPYWEDAKELMTGLLQSVPHTPGTSIIIESTAHGMGDYFHDLWLKSTDPDKAGVFKPVFIPWYMDKDYREPWREGDKPLGRDEKRIKELYGLDDEQVLWYRKKTKELGELEVQQEFPHSASVAFLTSGKPYFEREALEWYEARVKPPARVGRLDFKRSRPKFVEESDGPWHIWKNPVKGRKYVVFADVSEGTADDYSAIQVLDCDALEQVASYRGKVDPDELAWEIASMGAAYNWALVAPERNSIGLSTVLKLAKPPIDYPHLFRHINDGTISESESTDLGWRTTSKTRPLMLTNLAQLVRERELVLPDFRTVRELRSFVRSTNLSRIAEAQKGANDDMVMSLAGAVSIRDRLYGEIEFEVVDDDGFEYAL